MAAPKKITDLVERFVRNRDAYLSGGYNEAQVRQEFINPMFIELGWDIYNEAGFAEAYKDVVHEDSLRIGGAHKAPDYSFRVGGRRKFFLEAKKPSVNIMDEIHPAYQTRRYAWSAKLPLSILTDFDEFAVYDCRVKPLKTDKASTARIIYFKHTELEERWEEIQSIFSKDAVYKGDYDRYVDSTKKKRGTAEVDDTFLKEIERWREMLAKNIAIRNGTLDEREINFVLGRTIDRIIFLRMCEDRGIEHYGRLQALQNGTAVYNRLKDLYHLADERYNSGLFHFREEKEIKEPPDDLSIKTKIDDKPLKEIFKHLYYPDSPFEFSVLPPEILGQVYEQFLGKVIRLTKGHRAVVEYKPEVKKAGGIYYTPEYIVDYIVKNTVGMALEKLSVVQTAKLKIVDPACGSGSFLLNAYQQLLDWHLEEYSKNPSKHKKALYKGSRGEWRLTSAERKRILLNNIYGVDIDAQAVEVTKLSLLLKVLEGETEETLQQSLKLYHERALPDLSGNIKCGNSLIGSDFYDNQQLDFLGDEERYRINAFDWETEFPEIFSRKNPGFDVVIGNPPYGFMVSSLQKEYFSINFQYQDQHKDLYLLFLEKSEELIKFRGYLGVIVPNTWLQSVTLRKIRIYLISIYKWLKILHLPRQVFKAVVDTHVLVFQKVRLKSVVDEVVSIDIRKDNKIIHWHQLPVTELPINGDAINVVATVSEQRLWRKISDRSLPLGEYCKVFNGVKPFEVGKGNPPQTKKVAVEKPYVHIGKSPGSDWLPLLRGSLIRRYRNMWNHDSWISYGPWLAAPRDPLIFESPEKIMVRQTGDSIIGTIIDSGFIARNNVHIVLLDNQSYDLCYFMGFMNSNLADFMYRIMNPEKGEALAEIKKYHVEQLPIFNLRLEKPKDLKQQDKIVYSVKQMLQLNKDLQEAKTSHKKEVIQRQINATDKQIDKLVYKLYDLTEEEIAIVEGNSAS